MSKHIKKKLKFLHIEIFSLKYFMETYSNHLIDFFTTDEGSIPFAAPYGGDGTLVTACFQHPEDTYSSLDNHIIYLFRDRIIAK